MATEQLALTSLRSVLGQSELDEVLSERDRVNARLREIIDEQTEEPWGIYISLVEVKDVLLPQAMQRVMARAAELLNRGTLTHLPLALRHQRSLVGRNLSRRCHGIDVGRDSRRKPHRSLLAMALVQQRNCLSGVVQNELGETWLAIRTPECELDFQLLAVADALDRLDALQGRESSGQRGIERDWLGGCPLTAGRFELGQRGNLNTLGIRDMIKNVHVIGDPSGTVEGLKPHCLKRHGIGDRAGKRKIVKADALDPQGHREALGTQGS